jgi:hypothetical protein
VNPARGFGRGGHRRGVALAAVAAALLLLVVAVAVHMRLSGGAAEETSAGGPAAVEGVDQPAPAASGAPPADQDVLAGGDVSWVRRCGVDLPESDRYGPHAHDGDRRYGFTGDAGGAVVAAAHLLVQVSPQVGPDVFVPTIRDQVTGPDAQALADAVHTEYEQAAEAALVPYGAPLCPIYARLVGYVIDSHSPQAASLRMLAEGPGQDGAPQRVALLVQLSWVDGDWRLVAPPLGDWSRVSTLLAASATETFIPLAPGE